MVKSILGSKIGMTQIFDSEGHVVPVTVVKAGPCVVTQVKTRDTDGYDAVQIGFGETHAHRLTRAERGHLGLLPPGKAKEGEGGVKEGEAARQGRPLPAYRHLREIRLKSSGDLVKGSEIRVENFTEGDLVAVTGVTKGKGYAGVIKRHHFHGASMTHGVMEVHRKPASSGATDAARTFKGVKKPGHLGADRVTTRGLTVVRVDPERNLLLIKGAVPGATGGLLFVRALKGA
ncbi:MAG TPA: 50S ribosomal protein L3 [Armatimonadota bacterium]|nr:50S ribosomal protein L3 [Armatimonadota bacterium]